MLRGLLGATGYLRDSGSKRAGGTGMGLCSSTLGCGELPEDASVQKGDNSMQVLSGGKVFHIEVEAGFKAAEARARGQLQHMASPPGTIAAAPPQCQVSPMVDRQPQRQAEAGVPGSGSTVRARRLSLSGVPTLGGATVAADMGTTPRSSASGSLSSSEADTGAPKSSRSGTDSGRNSGSRPSSGRRSFMGPPAAQPQPDMPVAHPLPDLLHLHESPSPVKPALTHRGAAAAGGVTKPPKTVTWHTPRDGAGTEAAVPPAPAPASPPHPTQPASALSNLLLLRPCSPTRAQAAAAVPMSDLIHSVASLSRAGREPTYRKTNQDNCFAYQQYCRPNQALLAALDGHGPHGHAVSAYLRKQVPIVLADQLGEAGGAGASSKHAHHSSHHSNTHHHHGHHHSSNQHGHHAHHHHHNSSSGSSQGTGSTPSTPATLGLAPGGTDPAAALSATFLGVDEALTGDSGINCQYSGSTAVVCLMQGRRLTTAWVGDSKAVLARKDPRGTRAICLTRDHKPALPEERSRIVNSGGRVERLVDKSGHPVGPQRVWLSGSWVPGLAMSRALGDQVAHSVGVTSEPETSIVEVCAQDMFLLLATDGVWEFIDPQAAVDIVADCKDAEEACRRLVDCAWVKWLQEEEGVVDDITVVAVKFNPL